MIYNGISQEFQSFVWGNTAFLVAVDIGTVFEGLDEQVDIGEAVFELFLKLFQGSGFVADRDNPSSEGLNEVDKGDDGFPPRAGKSVV